MSKNKLWPKTRVELEKIVSTTKSAIDTGEKYLKEISEKGIKKTKTIPLRLKREKLYYELGRTVSSLCKSKWENDEQIANLIREIKQLDKNIGTK
jgi:hypothetical protein